MIKLSLNSELAKIVKISKDFGAEKVFLFGSCLDNAKKANDIDIAVSGIPPKEFFRYYANVSMEVKEEVDIVDLDDVDPHLFKRITSKWKVLYAR